MSRFVRALVAVAVALAAVSATGTAATAARQAETAVVISINLDQEGPIQPGTPVVMRVTAVLGGGATPLAGTLDVDVIRYGTVNDPNDPPKDIASTSGRAEPYATGRSHSFTPLEGGLYLIVVTFTPDPGNPQGVTKPVEGGSQIRVLRTDSVFHVDPAASSFAPGAPADLIATITLTSSSRVADGLVRASIGDGPTGECAPVKLGGADWACTITGLVAPSRAGEHTITASWTGSTTWADKSDLSTLVVAAPAGGSTGSGGSTNGGDAALPSSSGMPTSDQGIAPADSTSATPSAVAPDADPTGSVTTTLGIVVTALAVLLVLVAGAIVFVLLRRRRAAS